MANNSPLPLGISRLHAAGNFVVATGADPAAGSEFSITVPAGETWLVLAVSVACVQGITQTPWPTLVLDDGTTTFFRAQGGTAAMTASTTTQYTWAIGAGQVGPTNSTAVTGPFMANCIMNSGYRIRSLTNGIGANTDYGAPGAFVLKFT